MANDTRSHRRRRQPTLDGLPEQTHYADTGCEVAISCLGCPLPQCKFDDIAWYRDYMMRNRDELMLAEYHEQRLSVFTVAQRFNVSPRTVHRALRRAQTPVAAAG